MLFLTPSANAARLCYLAGFLSRAREYVVQQHKRAAAQREGKGREKGKEVCQRYARTTGESHIIRLDFIAREQRTAMIHAVLVGLFQADVNLELKEGTQPPPCIAVAAVQACTDERRKRKTDFVRIPLQVAQRKQVEQQPFRPDIVAVKPVEECLIIHAQA